MMKKLLFAVLPALLPMLAFAQLTLSGTITSSESGEPLPGSSLTLLNTFNSTSTDAKGLYVFRNLNPGNYSLKISYLGYKSQTLDIKLDASRKLDVSLSESPYLQDEVVVISTRVSDKSPITYQNIGKTDIQKINLGQDLPSLLENSVSSVSTSDAGNGVGYSAIRIRGTDITRINVTINGIPLNDPESHGVYWVDLPDFASSTENIQIQRGAGSSTNGAGAFGATINLQSNQLNPEAYAELSSSYGSFNTLKNTLSFGSGLINKHFALDGRLSRITSDGYIDRASSNLQSFYLSGAYIGSKSLIRINLFSGVEKTYQAWNGVPSDTLPTNRTYNGMGYYTDIYGNPHYYNNETDNYRQTHFQAFFSHVISQKLFLNAAIHYTKGYGYYEEYQNNDALANYGIAPIEVNSDHIVIDGVVIPIENGLITHSDIIRRKYLDNDFYGTTWSLNYRNKKLQSNFGGSINYYDGRHFGDVIWAQFVSNSLVNREWYRGTGEKSDINLFVKSTLQAGNKVNLYLDLQLRMVQHNIGGIDDNLRNIAQEHHYTFFNPKAGINYQLNNSNSFYGSFSVGNREPNRDNFVDADQSKPSPKAETLYDLEAGHIFKSSKLTLSSNIYFMDYYDQLVLTGAINDVGNAIMVNVPKSYRLGLEFNSQLMITRNLSWNYNFAVSKNKITRYTEYIDNWDSGSQLTADHKNINLAFSPSIVAGSELVYSPLHNLNIGLISKVVGRQYIDNTQDVSRSLHPYFVNNIRINYIIKPKAFNEIGFTFCVNNFLNEKYESNAWVYRYYENDQYKKLDGYFPQAGINFMAGIIAKI